MLSKFKLVGTEGLKGLNYKGDQIEFAQIDDKLAEELYGKTHVLQRVEDVPSAQLALEAGDGKKKDE